MVSWDYAEGMNRLELTISRHFWHPHLRREIRAQLSTCDTCKRMKNEGQRSKHGQLAPRNVPMVPWSEVHVDSFGPWKFKRNGLEVSVRGFTAVDPVTKLVEITRIDSAKTADSTNAFVNTWLSRYPLPQFVVNDNGPDFRGHEWEFMAQQWGITRKQITPHAPTANSVIETTHRTMGQVMRTILENADPHSLDEMNQLVENAIALTIRACRCSANTSLQGLAPGALVFSRDMHLNIPIVVDILALSQNQQLQTDLRLQRENRRRTRHEYRVGDMVFVNNHHSSGDKLKPAWVGPFQVLQVHTNGTITIQRGLVHERINIRRVKPR